MHARNIHTAESQDVALRIYDNVFPWFIRDIRSSFLPKLSITSTASIVTGAQWALDIAMIPLQFHKGRNPGHRRPRTVMIERCDSFPGLNVNRGGILLLAEREQIRPTACVCVCVPSDGVWRGVFKCEPIYFPSVRVCRWEHYRRSPSACSSRAGQLRGFQLRFGPPNKKKKTKKPQGNQSTTVIRLRATACRWVELRQMCAATRCSCVASWSSDVRAQRRKFSAGQEVGQWK